MINELKNKTDVELGELIYKLKIQLLEMRFNIANGNMNDVHRVKEIKKTIAVAMTVLSQRNVKISFSTHSTQLIKTVDGKQEIKSINNATLIQSEAEKMKNKVTTSEKKETSKTEESSSKGK